VVTDTLNFNHENGEILGVALFFDRRMLATDMDWHLTF
jgi:hypothetical protein